MLGAIVGDTVDQSMNLTTPKSITLNDYENSNLLFLYLCDD